MEIFKCQYLLDTPTASLRSVVRCNVVTSGVYVLRSLLHPSPLLTIPSSSWSRSPFRPLLFLFDRIRSYLSIFSFYSIQGTLLKIHGNFAKFQDKRYRTIYQLLYIFIYIYNLEIEESKIMLRNKNWILYFEGNFEIDFIKSFFFFILCNSFL